MGIRGTLSYPPQQIRLLVTTFKMTADIAWVSMTCGRIDPLVHLQQLSQPLKRSRSLLARL